MRKSLLLLIINLFLLGNAQAVFVPIQFTSGLNEDVIANGIGNASASTTVDMDGSNYVLVCQNYQATSSSTALTYGLPTNGILSSAATTGLTFKFSPFATPYTGSNVLKITGIGNGTLNFQTPITAQTVYLLITSTFTANLTGTINFADGTTQAITSTAVPNWYGGTTLPNAATGIGRILRTTNVAQNQSPDPRLYQVAVSILAANQNKLINSVTINNTSTTANTKLFVFAITVDSAPVSCNAPTALTATSLTPTGATLGWTQTGTPLGWKVIYGPSGFNPATSGTAVYTTTNSLTLSTLSPSTAYAFYVKAVCAVGDSSILSGPTAFTTPCQSPTISGTTPASRCGNGILTLSATTQAGATISWYAASTGGTALNTGNSFTTPALTTTTTYYAGAANGTCVSTSRTAVTATVYANPVVNIGHDTTICPGVAYTLNAQNAGSAYIWSNGATTQTVTVNAANSYYVKVTDIHNCLGYDTIVIVPGIVPVPNLPAHIDFCQGDATTLNAGNTGSTFLWSTGATTQTINVNTGGSFNVTTKSINGCKILDTTNITIRPLPLHHLGNDTSVCSTVSLLLDAGNSGSTYNWSTGVNTQTIQSGNQGVYSVTITSPYNCTITDDIEITFLPPPSSEGFDFVPQFFEQLGKVAFSPLNPRNTISYDWDFGDGTQHSTQQSPQHVFTQTGDYNVTLKVINDCSDSSKTQTIHVDLGKTTGVASVSDIALKGTVYPNPSNGSLWIEFNELATKVEQIDIYNITGAKVGQVNGKSTNKQEINMQSFVNGIYLLKVNTNIGQAIYKIQVLH